MAFYASDTGPGRTRSLTRRWTPGQAYYVNPDGTVGYLPRDLTPLSMRDWAARRMGMGRAVPPMEIAQPRRPGEPNPYGINAVTFRELNQGENFEEFADQRYLGGMPDDYASMTRVSVPYGSDNLSMRYHFYQKRPPTKVVYGRPIYREGMQHTIAATWSAEERRRWQAFFQENGFKTGPAGFWTEFEANAMRYFMTMANGAPGSMDIFTLRDRVMHDVANGVLPPGHLASMLGVPPGGQNALSPEGTSGGGGSLGEELAPYTETRTRRVITQFSTDQGMTLLRNEVARQVGRKPTDAEVAGYVKGLNAAFRADPTVITTITRVDPMAGTEDTTETQEETSVEPQARAAAFAETGVPKAEREGYQTSRYIDALMAELGI